MTVTLNSSALHNIYSGITAACFINKVGGLHLQSHSLPRSIEILKANLADLIEYDSVIYKKSQTIFNSPFITSFSKDAKDILNVDFNVTGLLLIKKCLEARVEILWDQADEARDDKKALSDIFDVMTDTESLIILFDEYMQPLYN